MSKRFELTEKHIKLLQNSSLRWDDDYWGGLSVDTKRPYGNSMGADLDILNIIDDMPKKCEHCNSVLEKLDDKKEKAMELHRETLTALQIILSTRSFEPGVYEQVTDKYTFPVKWVKVA